MTKLAYLECPTGIAGDMCLGALVHAGVPLEYLIDQLSSLGIAHEYQLWAEKVQRQGQEATKVHVDCVAEMEGSAGRSQTLPHTHEAHSHSHPHSHHGHSHTHHSHSPADHTHPHSHETHTHSQTRHLPEIEHLIVSAHLPPRATEWSLAIFRKLAEAEGAVHGLPPEQVHFHEVGATDAIVDIVGTCLGLDWLGIDQLYCSAFPTGGGTVRAAHGILPVPTPAVLKLWESRQVPVYSNGLQKELVTPTGAAIATTLATDFGPPPAMQITKIGLGAGSKELAIPNILRLWIGESAPSPRSQPTPASEPVKSLDPPDRYAQEAIALLETQIDDLNPQAIGYVFDALFAAGAVDVFTQAIGMKKSRPGILLSVLCPPEQVTACETVLFQETSTLGIRRSQQQRSILQRTFETVQTPYGPVRIKIGWYTGQEKNAIANVQPEYEDCAQLARQHHQPWRDIHRMALHAWYSAQSQSSVNP